jgi:hypothetical protein
MLRARVISEGIRTVFPGVAVGVYTPEEVADFDVKPAQVMPEPAPLPEGPSAELTSVLNRIVAATMESDLTALRPAIRELGESERAIAIQAGISRQNTLRAAAAQDATTVETEL